LSGPRRPYSRLASLRYMEALQKARDELVVEAEQLTPKVRELDDSALESKPRKVRAAVRAWRCIEMLRRLEFDSIISGSNNDDPAWSEWTDAAKVKARLARFKKPLGEKSDKTDPLAFLIVKSMLLTGFDAPIEGAFVFDLPHGPMRDVSPAQACSLSGVNDGGDAVGGCGIGDPANRTQHATLWRGGAMIDLNDLITDPSWILESAVAVNASGQIVGTGIHNGNLRAFILTPQ
jgi:hypothetical protein